jgi:hypothetical protein
MLQKNEGGEKTKTRIRKEKKKRGRPGIFPESG